MLVTLAAMVATGLAGAHRQHSLPMPPNVHPAVVEEVRSNPAKTLGVIVVREPGSASVEEAAQELGVRVTARWSFINSFAAELQGYQVGALATLPGVRQVLRNNPVVAQTNAADGQTLVNAYNYAVQADQLWAEGYNGAGVTVAVVDSGISESDESDFGNRLVRSARLNSVAKHAADRYGHGTHVASIVGGDGTNSGGRYIGIAPGVNLINVKFSDDEGKASEKELIDALQWVYDNRERYRIRVVNISSNVATVQSYQESAASAAVEQLWLGGVVVVVSAGNRGGERCSVCYAPAHDPFVISVGAVDDNATRDLSDDFMKAWSSRGRTLDGHMKPDVVAPGAHMVAYMPGGRLKHDHPNNVVDEHYFRMGGTSMAAPVVSGAVALLLQARPDLTPDQVKWLLMNTSRSYTNQPEGSPGIVSVHDAVHWAGTVGAANQDLQPSPLLDAEAGTIAWGSASWSNSSWSNASWSNASWANSVEY